VNFFGIGMKQKKTTLIVFGYDPWSDFWKRNQIITYLLSSHLDFDRVIFVNPILWFNYLSKGVALDKKIFAAMKKGIIPYKASQKIWVWTPFILPKSIKVISLLVRWLSSSNKRNKSIVLLNDPNAWSNFKLDLVDSEKLIFDWSDDFAEFCESNQEKEKYSNCIEEIINHSDKVICVNQNLYKRAKIINENSLILDNKSAININLPISSDETPNKTMSDLSYIKSLKMPIVGYVGWLVPDRLDCNLIEHAASQRPNYNFVFVGPANTQFEIHTLTEKYKNIHILESVPYGLMRDVINYFDVCILPNKINQHTDGNSPIKLYDYLSMEKPVVTTATGGTELLLDFISVANNNDDFVKKLDGSLNRYTESTKKNVEQFCWNSEINSLIDFLELKLPKK
jgi:hypothetical protein